MEEEDRLKKFLDSLDPVLRYGNSDIYMNLLPNRLIEKRIYDVLTEEPLIIKDIIKKTKSNHQRVQKALYSLVENGLCDVKINKSDKRTLYKFYRKNH